MSHNDDVRMHVYDDVSWICDGCARTSGACQPLCYRSEYGFDCDYHLGKSFILVLYNIKLTLKQQTLRCVL